MLRSNVKIIEEDYEFHPATLAFLCRTRPEHLHHLYIQRETAIEIIRLTRDETRAENPSVACSIHAPGTTPYPPKPNSTNASDRSGVSKVLCSKA